MPVPLQSGLPDPPVASLLGTVLVTLATFAVVVGTWRLVERLHEHDSDAVSRTWRHIGLSAASVLVTAAGGFVVIWAWGLTDPLTAAVEEYSLGPGTVVNVVLALVIFATAYGLTDLVGKVTRELADGQRAITDHQREIVYRLSQVSLYVVAGSIVLGLWGVDLGGLLVGAGFLGIVVGLAARQTLGALLAGFVLMFSRPFEIGDWVEIGDHEGIVTDITVVTTRIQTFDGEYVMVPNDVVSAESVVNRSRKGRLRIEVDVGIDYDADPRNAAEVARDAVRGLDSVLRVPTPQVVVKEFADSAIVLGVRVWIDNPSARRRWRTRTAVVSAVKEAFDREGVKIPFPQRELMGREETEGFVLSGGGQGRGYGRGDAADADPPAPTAEPDGGQGRDRTAGGDGGDDRDAETGETDAAPRTDGHGDADRASGGDRS
jgi:small-conductance mechanosensitive channel